MLSSSIEFAVITMNLLSNSGFPHVCSLGASQKLLLNSYFSGRVHGRRRKDMGWRTKHSVTCSPSTHFYQISKRCVIEEKTNMSDMRKSFHSFCFYLKQQCRTLARRKRVSFSRCYSNCELVCFCQGNSSTSSRCDVHEKSIWISSHTTNSSTHLNAG